METEIISHVLMSLFHDHLEAMPEEIHETYGKSEKETRQLLAKVVKDEGIMQIIHSMWLMALAEGAEHQKIQIPVIARA